MTETDKNNSELKTEPLPADRLAAVEQGLALYQATAAERDKLRREVADLQIERAGFKVAIEALQAQVTDAQSQMRTHQLERDAAVAERAKYETLFGGFLAQLRAFQVPIQPLIRAVEFEGEDDLPTVRSSSASERSSTSSHPSST